MTVVATEGAATAAVMVAVAMVAGARAVAKAAVAQRGRRRADLQLRGKRQGGPQSTTSTRSGGQSANQKIGCQFGLPAIHCCAAPASRRRHGQSTGDHEAFTQLPAFAQGQVADLLVTILRAEL